MLCLLLVNSMGDPASGAHTKTLYTHALGQRNNGTQHTEGVLGQAEAKPPQPARDETPYREELLLTGACFY